MSDNEMQSRIKKVARALVEATDEVRESFDIICKESEELVSVNRVYKHVLRHNNKAIKAMQKIPYRCGGVTSEKV